MMSLDLLRRFIYGSLLVFMVVDLVVVAWADQLDAQARVGWMPPLRPAAQMVDSSR